MGFSNVYGLEGYITLLFIYFLAGLTSDGNCEVEFDLDKEICEIAIHETSPVIDGSNEEDSSSEDESDFEGVDDSTGTENSSLELLSSDDILKVKASEALGDWEKYTKVRLSRRSS
jgi:hypothetical protein